MTHLRHVLSLLLVLVVVPAAHAATVTFTDRAAWTANVTGAGLTGLVPDDFAGIAGTGDVLLLSSLSRNGLTYTPNPGTQLVLADRDAPGYDFGVAAAAAFQLGFPSVLHIRFDSPAPVFGFGLDVGAFPAGGETTGLRLALTTTAGNSVIQFNALGGSALSFVGLRSEDRLLSVSLTGDLSADPVITNVTTASVPEPGSVLLVSAVLLGCTLARRLHAQVR